MRRVLTVFLLILFLASQCRQKESVVAPQIAKLIGTWQLAEPDSAYATTLRFAYDTANPPHDVTPFKASGKTAVNDYTVNMFATLDGMLSADELVSSKVAGSAEAMAFELAYFTNLKAVVRYEITSDNQLHLIHGGAQPHLLVYKRVN
ncbi:META domain-containing protein [Spirosoma pollinicola]|uniref:DUF306 domain-containing protein n=1 Tax=Spirosoma pollinicola TaxID=2057025 RepID=A0A2K8Z6Y6_9BACT|nr:META domain-containing protein [Spirosoma pollinicola]AUD05631.1 hypothetical protein CWM47_29585 [Spirosoma pollinicola]